MTPHERQVNLLVKERDALRARVAELERERDEARQALALVVWAQPGHKATVELSSLMTLPIPWETVSYELPDRSGEVMVVYPAPPPRLPQPEGVTPRDYMVGGRDEQSSGTGAAGEGEERRALEADAAAGECSSVSEVPARGRGEVGDARPVDEGSRLPVVRGAGGRGQLAPRLPQPERGEE